MDPEKILVVCQGGVTKSFVKEMEILFKSLILFGGKLSSSQKLACFSEPISTNLTEELTKLGVRIKIVKNLDERHIISNKIQCLELENEDDFDHIVFLDSDVVIAKDFSEFLSDDAVRAKPVDNTTFNLKHWESLFSFFNLELPSQRYITCFKKIETIAYFNAGVILIPRKYISRLYKTWKEFVPKLIDSYEKLPEIATRFRNTDQLALALALVQDNIPHKILPVEMNFPIHKKIHEDFHPEEIEPCIIHHHHRFSEEGDILHCEYDNINKIIDKINEGIKNFNSYR